MPDAENPAPKQSEETDEPTAPTSLTTSEFHERADHYLNELVQRLEEAQEKDPGIEVDYAVCLKFVALVISISRITANEYCRLASSK